MVDKELKSAYDFTWKNMEVGNIVTDPGNASARKTGDWRSDRPILDKEKCIKCAFCWLYCPDGVITRTIPPRIDMTYCKGCGICAEHCPAGAIEMIEETALAKEEEE